MKEKTFEVMGKKLIVKEVTNEQVEKMAELFQDLDMADLQSDSAKISKIIFNNLPEFMNIVFIDQETAGIEWGKVSYNLTDEILEHFFVLNERLKKRLTGLLQTLMSFGLASAQATK